MSDAITRNEKILLSGMRSRLGCQMLKTAFFCSLDQYNMPILRQFTEACHRSAVKNKENRPTLQREMKVFTGDQLQLSIDEFKAFKLRVR